MKVALTILAFCSALLARGAPLVPPPIEWQRSFGVSQEEFLYAVEQMPDGGYMVGGSSRSPAGGNKTSPNFGEADYWVVRLDSRGNQLWDRSFGGSGSDYLFALQRTADGGFILSGGSSSTPSGNKTSPHYGTEASHDYWVLRLDAEGNKMWEQSFGGNYSDIGRDAEETAGQGFVIGGHSGSPASGNKAASGFGNTDFWLVGLDANGAKLWDRSFGGAADDILWTLQKATDSGFLLGGASESPASGNKSSTNYGSSDFWLVRVDGEGNKVWDRSFGGTNNDVLYGIGQLQGGGFILGGRSASPPSGNKTSAHFGGYDFWVVRVDTNGNKVWEKSFGGTADEQLYGLDVTRDGGVIMGGGSASGVSGNRTVTNFGQSDFWVIRLDADGNEVWQASYGGSRVDELQSVKQTSDGGFIVGGWSRSPADGNKTTANYPLFPDYWVIKLAAEQPQLRIMRTPPTGCTLALHGIKNASYLLEWSTNLHSWVSLQTNRMDSSEIHVLDRSVNSSAQRFYRGRVIP